MSQAVTLQASLKRELAALDSSLLARLSAAGFDEARFLALAATLAEGDPAARRRTRNCVKGTVAPPRAGDVVRVPERGSAEAQRFAEIGEAVLARGELAFCTMAGGMATRMGGIVKALCEVIPDDGARHTFLSMRLRENATVGARAKKPVPLWLMTSEATHDALGEALAKADAPSHVARFMQDLSLRLTPEGSIFREDDGQPSVYATGHGDLVDALRRAQLLDEFVAKGGKYVWIVNIDNLGAAIDPVVLGMFVDGGKDVQCEVCRKEGDKGGIPVQAEGKLQVLEEFRLPPDFDPTTVNVFNTNTFLVRAEPLLRAPLTWTYFEVEKKVEGRPAIQFERLVQEITAHLSSGYVEVPRDGEASRFLPVKDFDELAKRRATIELVARARGMV